MYRGDIRLGDTIDIKFTTRQISGAPSTLGGTPAISAYVGNGTTQITAGITLTADFDGVTGLNNVRVVATSGNGFATATNVDLVITTGTVNSVSVVGEVIGSFSIEARSALMPTTVARTLDVSAGGEAGVDWSNVGSPTTAVNLSATNIDVDQVVASVSGAVGSVTGAVGSVTGAVGSVTGNVGGNVVGSVASVTAGVTLAANAITAAATAADFTTEIQSGLATAAALATAQTDLDNIDAKTTNLPTDPADQSLIIAATNAIVALLGTPAGVSVSADIAAVKAETASILTDTAEIGAAGAGLTALATQSSVNDLPTNAELATALDALPTAAENATAVLTTAMTESYRADGATGTLAQMQYEIIGHLGESAIVGTTKTINKVDGTTAAATFTLDSDTAPTSITRAT